MTIGDRTNADQVHWQLLEVLEKLSTLKTNKALYVAVTDFTIKAESLIEKAARGDSKALDEARSVVRWMEVFYHSSPSSVRKKIPTRTVTGSVPKSVEELLSALEPPSGWKKYRDVAVSSAITEVVTLSILFLAHLL